ncbi:MAG: TIM barrel protein [archaeon]
MAEEEFSYGNKNNIYPGSDSGLDPYFGKDFSVGFEGGYGPTVGQIGLCTDPRTANQVDAVSKKLSTGAKVIEIEGLQTQQLENIPKQHFKELERLKKLVGADLTFHGPTIEASGWSDQGWSEINREGSERQMMSAVEKAQQLDPNGNIVVTFHSTAGLPELATKIITPDGEVTKELIVFDERSGSASRVKPKENILLGKKATPEEEIKQMNKEGWTRELSNLAFHARQGAEGVERPLEALKEKLGISKEDFLNLYKKFKKGEAQKFLQDLNPGAKKTAQDAIDNINYGETYIRESYLELQNHFNKAWVAAEKGGSKSDLAKLKEYKDKLQSTLKRVDFDNPENLVEFGETIQRGVNTLNSLSEIPQSLKPMSEFITDKASETFSNIAFNAYKKFGANAPIISIENPPAGGALGRGEDLKKLVEESRKKFSKHAQEKLGMSADEAKAQAEKLIGVTWDVGHINMLRKYGYGDKELIEQTKKIAPMLKHVHLSDNFGFDHTELPMGMGDVPMKKHIEAIKKYNDKLKNIKMIAETGTWFGPQAFGNNTPFGETLRAFGSPVYAMQMAPYWSGAMNTSGNYSTGYGMMLPDQHFNLYGSGFSGLPPELGGQMAGRSRVSGTPMD